MVLVDTSYWQISSYGKPLNTCMYEIWDLVTCTYLTTQKIRMSYARYGVRKNQIKSNQITRHKEVRSFPYGEDFAMARLSEVLQLNLWYDIRCKKYTLRVVIRNQV